MSNADLPQPESEGTGLTFVRPLPKILGAETDSTPSFSGKDSTSGILGLLFPTKSQEDSGVLGQIVGIKLGHFIIEERIGRGGMGAVFRAVDTRLDRVVALKVLSPEYSSNAEAVQRFQNEARAAARLDHNNISRVFFIGEENGLHFIAFEFVTGTNIRNFILQKGKLSPKDAVNYTLQIAEALRHTSAANVVHRDIKPSNIIISPTGRATLVDLGLARQKEKEVSKDLTVAGTTLGTFDYISPEQAIDARNVDVRSDIYSLGCTIFHMLTGGPPYPDGTMFEKVVNHHQMEPPDIIAKNPQVSPQLDHIVKKMMSSNPDERYATPDLLITDLVEVAKDLGLRPEVPDTTVWTTPLFKHNSSNWSSTNTWMSVSMVLLVTVLLVDRGWDSIQSLAGTPTAPVPMNPVSADTSTGPAYSGPLLSDPSHSMVADSTPLSTGTLDGHDSALDRVPGVKTPVVPTIPVPVNSSPMNPTELASNMGVGSQIARNAGKVGDVDLITSTVKTNGSPEPMPDATTADLTESEPFVLQASQDTEPRTFSTLAAAIAAAPDNSVIEIRRDGRIPVQMEPIKINNKRIRLRPALSYRPVIQFNLSEHLTTAAFTRTAQAFDLNRGALEVYDLDMELVVDVGSVVDRWAMLRMSDGSEFTARGVSMTIINPQQHPASFLSFPEAEATTIGTSMPERMKARPRVVKIDECVFRGQADFTLQQSLSASRFQLQQTAFALSGSLFRVDGSTAIIESMDLEDATALDVSMTHVTSVTREGLLMLNGGTHGTVPNVRFDCHNSLFRVDAAGQALMSITGEDDFDVLVDRIDWTNHSDPNFLQITGPFCAIDSPSASFDETQVLGTDDFGAEQSQLVSSNLLAMAVDQDVDSWHTVQPAELSIRNGEDAPNPALQATSDRRNAGVDWNLDRFPASLPEPI